jgi:hypothetical protein
MEPAKRRVPVIMDVDIIAMSIDGATSIVVTLRDALTTIETEIGIMIAMVAAYDVLLVALPWVVLWD